MERLENYFVTHDIKTEMKKRAVLLSKCEAATCKLIRCLVVLQKPSKVEYKALLDKTKEHFAHTPSCIVEHYKFISRVQESSESVASFVTQLHLLLTHCKFGNMLEDMLYDRIICGILDIHVQCRLLAEPKLTFAKVMELSQYVESAEKDSKTILPRREAASVNLTHTMCYHCGKEHSPDTCRFKESFCLKVL